MRRYTSRAHSSWLGARSESSSVSPVAELSLHLYEEGHAYEEHGEHAGEGEGHEHEEYVFGHGEEEEISYALSQVKSNSEDRGSSITAFGQLSVDKLFSGEPKKNVMVHEAGSGNPPILTCADLERAG